MFVITILPNFLKNTIILPYNRSNLKEVGWYETIRKRVLSELDDLRLKVKTAKIPKHEVLKWQSKISRDFVVAETELNWTEKGAYKSLTWCTSIISKCPHKFHFLHSKW